MSAPEPAEEARRWPAFAEEDSDGGRGAHDEAGSGPRHARWFAQQSAEKALTAALVLEGIEFPFRHDLDALRNLLPAGWRVKQEHSQLADLTVWAVEARYPGDWPEATREDARRAVLRARAVLSSMVEDFRGRGIGVRRG